MWVHEDIQILTEEGPATRSEAFEKYGDGSFDVQRGKEYRGALRPIRFLAPFLEKKPVVRKEKCIGCGICVQVCPVEGKAVALGADKRLHTIIPSASNATAVRRCALKAR